MTVPYFGEVYLAVDEADLLPGASGSPFVAIDFETADAGRDSACSVAVVRVEGEKIVDSFASLVRPPRTSTMATHIHGISEAAQRAAPPLRAVWPRLAPLLQGVDLIVAHNAAFDRSVLLASWASAGLTPPGLPWGCTVKMARRIWPKGGVVVDHTLPTLARLFGITLRHHQADSDAEACARLVLIARAEDRGERPPPPARKGLALAPAPAPRPLPPAAAPREPEAHPDELTPLNALLWGQQAREQGGDVLKLQEQLDNRWVRALVSCGWTIADLESDLRRLYRQQEGVTPEARLDALRRLLDRPRRAPADFVEQVRAMLRASDRRQREWTNSSPEQRQALRDAADATEDAVRTSLEVLR